MSDKEVIEVYNKLSVISNKTGADITELAYCYILERLNHIEIQCKFLEKLIGVFGC